MKPRVAFKTIGCRLNQAETARIAADFRAAGYQVVPWGMPCDAAIVHGCVVTHNAERDTVRAGRQARRSAPEAVIVLAGCPAEVLRPGTSRTARHPSSPEPGLFHLLLGQAEKWRMTSLLHQQWPERFPEPQPSGTPPLTPQFETTRALIKVQDGCDFCCAYCIVPAARGAPRSRPLREIAEEARRLADAGYREVVLTGANLGTYQDGAYRLVDVLTAVEAVPGIERIRLSSIEITTVERMVVDYMADSAKLCRSLHIPLQSGDDRVLQAMGRRYTSAQYRACIKYAVSRLPLLGLGTDVIVGFPGEDEPAFAQTERLIAALPFSNLHVFPYSPRPGTAAANIPERVPAAVVKRRVGRLLELEARQREAFAARFVGREVAVLIEHVNARGAGHGWTSEYLEAEVADVNVRVNEVRRGRVSGVNGARLLVVAE